MSEQNQLPVDENTASQRHWLYGFNAFVLILVGLVALIILLVITEQPWVQNHTKFDWSSNGANSLSSGSRKMLADVNSKPDKYAIWNLFTGPSDEVKRDEPDKAADATRRRQQVNDLLLQYQRASKQVLVDDRGDSARDEIERQLRDRYKDDFAPYEKTVDAYDPLVKELSSFLKTEAAVLGALGQKPGTTPTEAEFASEIQADFASDPPKLDQDQRLIHREIDMNTLPDWGMLTSHIGDTLSDIEAKFSMLSDPAKLKAAGFPGSLVTYFTSANDKYKAIEKKLKDYRADLDALKPLKVQDILSGLGHGNAIIILGPGQAKLLDEGQLYPASGDRTATGVNFMGEQLISSALYSMANPNKVKVVFVTPTPQHLLDDSYQVMKAVLEDANFEVLEWSPAGAPQQPGAPPEGGGPPPATGKGVVWIVFPPDSGMASMMGGPPNPQPVINAVRDHMDHGGQVLFMADASGGFAGPAPYAYADLIKDFGIEVEGKYHVGQFSEQTDPNTGKTDSQFLPFIVLNNEGLVDHEITKPIMGLPIIFAPVQTQSQFGADLAGQVTVVRVLKSVPSGATAQEIARTPYGPDYWASGDPSAFSGGSQDVKKFNAANDLASPVPLMAVGVRDKGKKASDGSLDEKRIAVVGAKMLGHDYWLTRMTQHSDRSIGFAFPGNAELMKNTVLWLAGYENMIAVSPKANATARIGEISKGWKIGTWLIVFGAPFATLAFGLFVWLSRHKQ